VVRCDIEHWFGTFTPLKTSMEPNSGQNPNFGWNMMKLHILWASTACFQGGRVISTCQTIWFGHFEHRRQHSRELLRPSISCHCWKSAGTVVALIWYPMTDPWCWYICYHDWGILMGSMLPYVAAPWILWVLEGINWSDWQKSIYVAFFQRYW
jgi:hypothetical protein